MYPLASRVFNNIGAALAYMQGQSPSTVLKVRALGTFEDDYLPQHVSPGKDDVVDEDKEVTYGWRGIGKSFTKSNLDPHALIDRLNETFRAGKKIIVVDSYT